MSSEENDPGTGPLRWYFAYGSNLSIEQMRLRTGFDGRVRVCRLPGYRLAFNKRSFRVAGRTFANIVEAPGAEVWGVAYECRPQAIEALDVHEYVAQDNYRHHPVTVVDAEGRPMPALAYVASPHFLCERGRPTREYLQLVLSGARHHGLPADYVQTLADLVARHEAVVS